MGRIEMIKQGGCTGSVETLEMIRRLTEQRDAEKMQRVELGPRLQKCEEVYGALHAVAAGTYKYMDVRC